MQKAIIIGGFITLVLGGLLGVVNELFLGANSIVVGAITGGASCAIYFGLLAKYIKKDGDK